MHTQRPQKKIGRFRKASVATHRRKNPWFVEAICEIGFCKSDSVAIGAPHFILAEFWPKSEGIMATARIHSEVHILDIYYE